VVKVGDEARYASAVDALLHYSDKVAQVRMYSFVQSVAVLGALFFLASEWANWSGAILFTGGLIGLVGVAIMNALGHNYYRHHSVILKSVLSMEHQMEQAGANPETLVWMQYNAPRKGLSLFNVLVYHHAIYLLSYLVFALVALFGAGLLLAS
jgi:hypothetical protein